MNIIKNIQKSQKQYLDLIKGYEQQVFSNEINQKQIAMIIDEIYSFWLDKKDILTFELNSLTSTSECFILSGALYLNIKNDEHYPFKALGKEHIISDPLLKLEDLFRASSQVFNNESIEMFKRTFIDLITLLSEYQEYFYILPINMIAIENQDEHIKSLQIFFFKFINTMFNENINKFDVFFEKYSSYNQIENSMKSFFKSNLIFNDLNDNNLSLKDKIEKYIHTNSIMGSLLQNKTDAEKFIIALNGLFLQVIDILLISSITNIIPYIRTETTFSYFTIVMQSFLENEAFKNMIEKTIISYLFYNIVKKDILVEVPFDKFVSITQKNDFLRIIIKEIKKKKINIFNKGIKRVETIIENKFCDRYLKIIKEKI